MRKVLITVVLAVLAMVGVSGSAALTTDLSNGGSSLGSSQGVVSSFPSGTWNTGVSVQNLSSSSATVVIEYYSESGGSAVRSYSRTLAGNASTSFYGPDLTDLPAGRYSAVVSSDQAIAAIANQNNTTGLGLADAYPGMSAGATSVSLPLVYKYPSGWNSLIAVQNTSSSSSAPVWVSFYRVGSAIPTLVTTATIPANSPAFFDVTSSEYASLVSDSQPTFLGSVTITSTLNIVAVVDETRQTGGYDVLTMFTGVTSGSSSYVAPLVYKNFNPVNNNGWTTGINVQNMGSSAITATMVYTISNADILSPGTPIVYTKTASIAGNSLTSFWMPDFPDIPSGTFGSAVVRSSGGNPIAVAVNTTKYATGVANGYNALPSSAGTRKVIAPLVYNHFDSGAIGSGYVGDNGSWTTGITIFNLGNSADTASVTFTGSNVSSSWTYPLSVPANGSSTFKLSDWGGISKGVWGSAVITTTSQPIVALVNTTRYNAGFATAYAGINVDP